MPTTSGRGVGESLILKRRERESYLANYTTCVKGMQKMNARADWESLLCEKGEETEIYRTAIQLKNQEESNLHSRRLKLAALYNDEMRAWKEAYLSDIETPEDRKQKMIARALELKEKREKERLAIVEEKLRQKYRESCDDLRAADSHHIQGVVLRQRQEQLHELKEIQARELKYKEEVAETWEKDRLKKEEREKRDRENALKRDAEVKEILDLQVNLVKQRRLNEQKLKEEEDRTLLSDWERLQILENEKEEQRKLLDIQRAMDVKQFNESRVEARKALEEKEKQYDLALLTMALNEEAALKQKEKEMQEKLKSDTLEYQQMLKKQIETEAEDLSYLDQIRAKMESDVWEKRDAAYKAEERARQELLRQVLASRSQQLQMKEDRKQQMAAEENTYMEEVTKQTEDALAKELKEQEAKAAAKRKHQLELLEQQRQKQQAEEQKKQTEFLELKRMQQLELKHREKVKELAQQPPTTIFRRKTAQWYYDA